MEDMPLMPRHPGRLLLAAALLVLLLPVQPVAATTVDVPTAEALAVSKINAERTNRGLVPLRVDSRIATIAGKRASYMASTGYFSHTQKDGTTAFSLMNAAGIVYYAGGEIIAWNTGGDLAASATYAVNQWMASSGHRAQLLSTNFNYFALGLAVASNGRRYWAGVFIKGPDRSGAWTKIKSTSKTIVNSTSVRLAIAYDGGDTRLQVLTSGFYRFVIERRVDGGDWVRLATTTAEWFSQTVATRHDYGYRIRARDNAGNWGGWKYVSFTT
jgi:uncharacterized protein YkwD